MMKKSIFAVAVASALTFGAAQAETVLYGSIRYDYNNAKHETVKFNSDGTVTHNKSKHLSNLEDAGSRIGLKGSEDLGNGNAVIFNLEWGFNGMTQSEDASNSFKNRLAYMGLTGNWGTFTAGRQNNPFKVLLVDDSVTDGFNGTNVISSASQRAMTTTLTGGATINDAGQSRVGKVIAYTTPDFSGFYANAAIMMDADLYDEFAAPGHNQQKTVDLWTINAHYAYDLGANGTILAKAGYINGKLADNNSSKAWGLFLGYQQEAFSVTASYANGNHKEQAGLYGPATTTGPKEKSQGWDIGGSFSFGPNYFSTVRVAYGENQLKIDGEKDKVKSWAVGFEQKLSTRTRAWVEYGNEKTKYHDTSAQGKDNVISIGMRHDF